MGKYILITGGELRNKGAQAMTFITVDEIRKRYPDKSIILLSNLDYQRSVYEKENYTFSIMPIPRESIYFQSRLLSKIMGTVKVHNELYDNFAKIIRDTAAIIDISGYSFGSNWGTKHSFYYLLRFRMAKVWGIPFYLMPQSFGPFDFKGKHAPLVKYISKSVLKKAKVIMARESDGKEGLEVKYNLKNVVLTPDLVLQNKGIQLSSVYKVVPNLLDVSVPKDCVALIPNSKNIKYSNEEHVMNTYKRMIDVLLKKNKTVHLVFHAIEDKTICQKLKETYFKFSNSVVFIENELSCIEFEKNIGKYQFIIASRYHSIVHSYKMFVPAIILGWASKYKELSSKFDQVDYCFDISSREEFLTIESRIEYMCDNFAIESQKIKNKLVDIQKYNVYDYINIQEADA